MSNNIISDRVKSSTQSSTVRIADKATSLKEEGHAVFDFSAGRAFEPTPSYVIEAADKAMRSGDTHQTMAQGTTKFRKAVAKKLKRENGIEADFNTEVVATMGCKQGLTVSLLTLLNPGDEVIVEDPCFVSYIQTIQYLGGVPKVVPLRKENNFRWDKGELERAVSNKTKAIILCTPHNPTGVVHTHKDLQDIADVAIKHNITVITDEPYERAVWGDNKHINLATLPGMKGLTITLMSLTKSFSMGGWRIGFAYADREKIEQMTKLQQHLITCTNSFVQAGAIEAYGREPQQEVVDYWVSWEKKVNHFTQQLDRIEGVSCYTPEGGFYGWVDISDLGISCENFANQIIEQEKVAVVPGLSFGSQGKDRIRITCVKSWEEIEVGLERIKNFIGSL